MILLKKLSLIATIAFYLFSPKNSFAQCLNPAWNSSGTYSAGDIVSHDGKDWEAIPSGQHFIEPSDPLWGHNGWTEVSNPCASAVAPTVASTDVRGTYCTTSFGVGIITNDGGATITARGFVFSLSPDPNLNDDAVLLDAGTGTGDEFEGLMDNLTPETTYYIKTYATNSVGTTYGTETSFTMRASADCEPNCALACDMTDASLLDPSAATWADVSFSPIAPDDTVCITQDVTISGSIRLQGMLKVCNGAQITLSGSITVQNENTNVNYRGQVVYEGCDEIFDGVGAYTGEWTGAEYDPKQMISYCETCVENDQSQFLRPSIVDAYWAATCRPTSTLINPLPVELTEFTAKKDKKGVVLNWTTNSEINNSHFEVELSYDGINWNTIGIIQGAGNSIEINKYQFIDNQIGSGVQYYRLKQLDFDGTESYSNVNYVSFDDLSKPKSFVAFQNQNNKIEVEAVFSGMGEAFLIDTRGRILENLTFVSTDKSGLRLEFKTTNLTEGVYFVKIKSGNALLGQKVQVVNR